MRILSLPNPDNLSKVEIQSWEEFAAVMEKLPVESIVKGIKHFVSECDPDTILTAILSHPNANTILVHLNHEGEFFCGYLVLQIKLMLGLKYCKKEAEKIINDCLFRNVKDVQNMQSELHSLAA